jgi:hypothetical protein
MSNGRIGCVPVTAKYDEHPILFRDVTLSTQNTEYDPRDHFSWSPSTALKRD